MMEWTELMLCEAIRLSQDRATRSKIKYLANNYS